MATFEVLEAFRTLRRDVALLRAAESKDFDWGHNQISILYRLSLSRAKMGELADYTFTDKASITRTIAVLERRGLVKRTSDPKDKRITYIELTKSGKQQAQKAKEIRDSIGKRLDACLSKEERVTFGKLVQKITEGLNLGAT